MGVSHTTRAARAARRLHDLAGPGEAMPSRPQHGRHFDGYSDPPPQPTVHGYRHAGAAADADIPSMTTSEPTVRPGKQPLSDLIGVRSTDQAAEASRAVRDKPRIVFTTGHALAVILLLIAALAISLTLLIQQSMNLAAMSYASSQSPDDTQSADVDSRVADPAPTPAPSAVPETGDASDPQSDPTAAENSGNGGVAESDNADTGTNADDGGLINLNTASATQLQELKGVGPVTAQRIIDHRSAIGRYTTVDQLLDVKGIGMKTLNKIRGQVTV